MAACGELMQLIEDVQKMVYTKDEFRLSTEPLLLSPKLCDSQVTVRPAQPWQHPAALHMD